MRWPALASIIDGLALPAGVAARAIARDEIAAVCAWLTAHDAGLAIGDAADLLAPQSYDAVALAGEPQAIADRPALALVLTIDGVIAGCLVLAYEVAEQAVFRRLLAAPDALVHVALDLEERIGRALAAKVAYGFVALDDRARCAALTRAGRLLCGVLPNSDRALVPGLGVRFVPRAIYAKLLVADDELQWPARAILQPTTAALLDLLFEGVPAPLPPVIPAAARDRRAELATHWPPLAPIVAALRLPARVTLRQLARGDLAPLVERLPAWYPAIATTAQRQLLTAAFYDHVAFADEDQTIADKPIHARVFVRDGELIGFTYSICEPERSTLRAELIVIDPRHRGLGLVLATLPFKLLLARALGVDTVVAMATLHDRHRQMAAERSGFRLAALLPAAGIDDSAGAGRARHVFEAMYAQSLVPANLAYRPPASAMEPRVAAVADFVLGPVSPSLVPGESHDRQ